MMMIFEHFFLVAHQIHFCKVVFVVVFVVWKFLLGCVCVCAIKLMFENDDRQIMLIYMWQITHTCTHGKRKTQCTQQSLEHEMWMAILYVCVDWWGWSFYNFMQHVRSLAMMITIETVKCVWNLFTTRARKNTNKITIFSLVRVCVCFIIIISVRFFCLILRLVVVCVPVTVLSIY